MGGDGGVIASNRRYLRGAGTADKMGDRTKGTSGVESEELECLEKMQNCALTGHAFDYKNDLIVTCAFGNLYKREASIEALLSLSLSRKQSSTSSDDEEESPSSGLGKHIRKLKDLVPVYFNLVKDSNEKYVPTCPITNVEFNGKQPAFVIVKKKLKKDNKAAASLASSEDEQKENKVNVLSERAIKEIGMESLQLEYGPFEKDDIIRLAPSSRDLIQIKEEYERRCEENNNKKEKKKKKKNRSKNPSKKKKRNEEEENTVAGVSNNDSNRKKKKKKNSSLSSGGDAASQARSNVIESISSNSVFSSIFKSSAEVSEKEKKDNLFAR